MLFNVPNRPKPTQEHLKLLEDIDKTKFALETAYSNFDNVTEPDLIDCYIYEVNSSLKRYKYLLEQAAKLSSPPKELTVDPLLIQGNLDLSFEMPCSLATGPSHK